MISGFKRIFLIFPSSLSLSLPLGTLQQLLLSAIYRMYPSFMFFHQPLQFNLESFHKSYTRSPHSIYTDNHPVILILYQWTWRSCQPEVFDTIVSVSKVRYFQLKVSYRYHISIEILNLKSISISIGIEISDIKVSISVSVSPFSKASLKFSISANFIHSGSLKCY